MKELQKYLMISLMIPLSIMISGCSQKEPEVKVITKLVEKEIPKIERPKKVNLNKIKLYVVTENVYNSFKKRFLEKNSEFVFIAISVKDYENLSLNISELRRYILQQKDIIQYYEDSIKKENKE